MGTAMPPEEVRRRAYKRHSEEELRKYNERMAGFARNRNYPSDPLHADWFPKKTLHASRTRMGYIVWVIRKYGTNGTLTNGNVPDAIAKHLHSAGIPGVGSHEISLGLKLGEEWGWLRRHVFGKRTTAVDVLVPHPGLAPPTVTTRSGATPRVGDTKPSTSAARPPAQVEARLDTMVFGGPAGDPSRSVHAVRPGGTPGAAARQVVAQTAAATAKSATPTEATVTRIGTPPLPKPPPRKAYREDELMACLFRFEDEDLAAAQAWIDEVIVQLTPAAE